MTLNQAIPDWDTGSGVFSQLNSLTTTPWGSEVSSIGLDIAYHGARSGDKYISPLVYRWLDENAELTPEGFLKLTTAISAMYYQKWRHLWETYTREYNPLDTYSVTETGTDSGTKTGTGSDTRTPNLSTKTEVDSATTDKDIRTPDLTTKTVLDQDDTDTRKTEQSTEHGETITTTPTTTTNIAEQVYGFNSADPSDRAKSTTTVTGSTQEVHSGTDTTTTESSGTNTRDATNTETVTGTDTTESTGSVKSTDTKTETGTDVHQTTHSDSESSQYQRTRTGNMYRSPAELLNLDRDFWLQDYFSIVFKDVDEMLTLAIYSEADPKITVF